MIEDFINDISLRSYVDTIQSTEDIIKRNIPFKIVHIDESEEKLFQIMLLWKKKLQIGINLRINNAFFNKCVPLSCDADFLNKHDLLCYFSGNGKTLNNTELTEAAVKYAYYFAVLLQRYDEVKKLDSDKASVQKIRKMICFYCDNEVQEGKNECEICEGQTIEYITIAQNFIMPETDSLQIKTIDNKESGDKLPLVSHFNVINSKENSHIILPEDKWKCSKCSFLNDLWTIFCVLCSQDAPHKNKWRCGRCTFINKPSVSKCTICRNDNKIIKKTENYNINYFKKIEEEKSVCWFQKCNGIVENKMEYCPNCGLQQSGSKEFGGLLMKKQKNEDFFQIWICTRCVTINKFDDKKCGNCSNETITTKSRACLKCGLTNAYHRQTCVSCKENFPKIDSRLIKVTKV